MSKTWTWVVVAAVIVVGGYFFMHSQKSGEEMAENQPSQTADNSVPSDNSVGKKVSFSDFLKQGGAYQCTVNQNVGGTETQGSVYVDNGMVSGTYNTQVQGIAMTSNVLVRDGYSYSWSSILPGQGFKAKVVASAPANPSAPASSSYSWNANQIGDYNCQAWTADSSKFEIPASITWKDVSA